MTLQLQIFLFGDLQAVYEGKRLQLKFPPKTIPLWAYLLLHRERVIARQTLAFTLWPDVAETTAYANLRRHLYQLNQALPAVDTPWLLQNYQSVQWNPQATYWLDVAEFERLSRNTAKAEGAIALYGGDLLTDCYDDWIFPERERLRTLYLTDLTHLIGHCRSQRRFPQAIAFASRLLAVDPLREDTVRLLMALHYETGDRAGALKEYAAFRRCLHEELRVDPMPETVALGEAILRNRALSSTTQTEDGGLPPAAREARLTLPFVGRESGLELINLWWTRAIQGQGRLLLISGEAGVGKTRLMEEFMRLSQEQGGRVLWGNARAVEAIPYQAIVRALRSALPMLAALEIGPLWLAAVSELIPEIRSRRLDAGTPLPTPVHLDPDRDRNRLFEGIARCLEGLARPRPLVLILDDLHWAGAGTARLLEFLARRAPQHRLLILAAYRQDEIPGVHPLRKLRRHLQADNLITHLALGRLNAQAVHNMIAGISGLGEEAIDLARQLYAVSEGNPFFLSELILDRIEAGDIRMEGGRWQVQKQMPTVLPARMDDAIAGRVTRLDAASKSLAEVAAIIGASFNVELLREVCGWSESKVLDALDVLMDYHLVREATGRGRFDYAFAHHLIQTTLYEHIPVARRRRRHRRVAHVLLSLNPQQRDDLAVELAFHFERGGEPQQAAGYHLRAARRTLAAYADDEALDSLQQALKLASDPALRYDVIALQEDVHHRHGTRAAQETELSALAVLAGQLHDNDRACDVLRRRIRLARSLGQREVEGELVAALKQRAATSGLTTWQAEALRAEATYHMLLSQYDSSRVLLKKALWHYRSMDDVRGQVTCLCLLAEIAVHQSRFDQVDTLLRQANALVEALDDLALLARTLGTASRAAFTHRDFGASRVLAGQMLALCRTIGDREGEADAHARLAATLARLFQVSRALGHYEKATSLYADMGKRQGQAAVLLNRGMLANTLGRYAEAMAGFRQAELLFAAMHDRRGIASCAINLSAVAIYQGDYRLAQEYASAARALAHTIQIPLFEAAALGNLGEAELKLGEPKRAIAHLTAAVALRRQQHLPPEDSATDLSLLTLAHLHAGKMEQARRMADELLELVATKADTIYDPQLALWAAVQTYRARGQSQRGGELLSQANAILQEKAAAIPDPESRAAFLQIPTNRELQQAWEEDIWPDSTVA